MDIVIFSAGVVFGCFMVNSLNRLVERIKRGVAYDPWAPTGRTWCACGHEMGYHGAVDGYAPGCDQCHCSAFIPVYTEKVSS